MVTAIGASFAICSPISREASTTSLTGTTRRTRPVESASSAYTRRPVSIQSKAVDAPTRWGEK